MQPGLRYELCYDLLIIAVGAKSNTFNIPGVEKYAHFLKEVTDARAIRTQIVRNFELALQPGALPRPRPLPFLPSLPRPSPGFTCHSHVHLPLLMSISLEKHATRSGFEKSAPQTTAGFSQ